MLSSLPAGARTPEAATGQDSCPAPLQSRGWGGREWTEPCGGPRGIQLRGATGRCCPQRPAHPTVSPASTLATDTPSAPSFLHLPLAVEGGSKMKKEKKNKPTHQCKADIFMSFLILLGIQRSHLTGWPGVWVSAPGSEGARGWAARSSRGSGLLPSAQLQHPATERGSQASREPRGRRLGWAGRERVAPSACVSQPLAPRGRR